MTSKSTAALRAAGGLGASRLAENFKKKVKCKMDAKFLPRINKTRVLCYPTPREHGDYLGSPRSAVLPTDLRT